MSRHETLLQAAELAKQADEITARLSERDEKLAADIKALEDAAEKESADDRKELSRLDAEIAKLVGGSAAGTGGQGSKGSRKPPKQSAVTPANADEVLKLLKTLKQANAKTISGSMSPDVTTAAVAAALSVLKDEGKVAAAEGSRGRYRDYVVV